MPERTDIYKERINFYDARLSAIRKKLSLLAWGRLAVFLFLAIAVYAFFEYAQPVFLYGAIVLFILFIVLVRVSFFWKDRKSLSEQMLLIYTNEWEMLQDKPNRLENGSEWHDRYLDDLDIFGEGSLFHLLNRATTRHGRDRLSAMLQHPLQEKPDILQYQQAVQVLSQEEAEKRALLMAAGLLQLEKDADLNSVANWITMPNRLLQKKGLQLLRWLLPAYNLAALLYLFDTSGLIPLVAGIAASYGLLGLYVRYINEQHAMISRKQNILQQYSAILSTFGTVSASNSMHLQALQKTASSAYRAIEQLSKLSRLFDQRLNMLVGFFLNMFFLYDIHIMTALERWRSAQKDRFPEWIHCVGEIEYVNSLAIFAFNYPDYHYPEMPDLERCIEAKQLAHPLIPAHERVANDFSIGKTDRIQLITGSNMSGKTTFLRTVGINMILAQCGAPVCALQFVFSPMRVCSAIRVTDSLREHTSYFLAELKRLQHIMQQLQQGEQALVLTDEILQGTNSDDKTQGSEGFIVKLLGYNCVALFATHDLSLGKMENAFPGMISNYCFESSLTGDILHFDYKINRGLARNRNATFLMKKMGII